MKKQMKEHAVHHLHVKYRGEVFTVFHRSDAIPMSELIRVIEEIKESFDDSQR